jgi:hypothetical protein
VEDEKMGKAQQSTRLTAPLILRLLLPRVCLLLLGVWLLVWTIAASAASAQKRPFVVNEVKHDISEPLSKLAEPIPPTNHFVEMKELEQFSPPNSAFHVAPGSDPVIQFDGDISNKVSVTRGFNFDAMNGSQAGGRYPPDTNGAVGDKQFVLIANIAYSVYDKRSGKQTLGPVFIHSIWKGFGGQCETHDGGDPVVLYDKLAHRWLVEQLEYTTSRQICVAVSATDDATGRYHRYAYTFNDFPDYPKVGIWPDAYYISFDDFGPGYAVPCAIDRSAMLAGKTANMICFAFNAPNFKLLPSDIDGNALPPRGAPNHYVEMGPSTNYTVSEFEFHVDFAHPKKSTFKGPNTITVPVYNQLCAGGFGACIPQPNGGSLLSAIGNGIMFRNAYRNFGDHESLVFVHSVAPGGNSRAISAERWYELRATPPGSAFTLYQAGTFQNKKDNYWAGSIAMDKVGDIALGFSVDNSTTLDPSIWYTGRVPTDPLGKMEASKSAINGMQAQSGSNRWGDYSSMSVDPTDDCSFWYTQEYAKNGGVNWQSHVVSFKFNRCQ